MSLRSRTAPAPPRAARPPRAEAPTGCGSHAAFGGKTIPCGFLVSSSDSLSGAFVVTSKGIGQLDPDSNRLESTTPDTQTTPQIEAQKAMNTAMKSVIYRNIFTYGVARHNETFDAKTELAAMGAVPWEASGATEKAYAEIVSACEGCELVAFRKI